ncbi:MAG TPA: hypothetical protein VEO01_13700 [Pseudonocardiaceae bacterium]|nr:hypothetical protein [Pseudonocardiaceae bacterium]
MTTPEEIRRRVEEADTARSTKRSAAAQQVGELARQRAAIAEQLADVERQLGEILTAARDVMDIDELARFTDVPAADLTRWLTARKTSHPKRKRPLIAENATSRTPSAARTPTASQQSTPPEPAVPRPGAAARPARVPADVT